MTEKNSKLRWGIVATGGIAHSMAHDLLLAENSTITAVASRNIENATVFAEQYNIEHAYGSYQAIFDSSEVDVVYIATPHPMHHQLVLAALVQNKHVVCEKPITLNRSQALECITLAKQKQLFLLEAVWMRFFPAFEQLKNWMSNNEIGDIQALEASFCIDIPFDESHRLYNPNLGGGALLDLGIYPISLAHMLLGSPSSVHGECVKGVTGVDELNHISLHYNSGTVAYLRAGSRTARPICATVFGTHGKIDIHETFLCPAKVTLRKHGEAETSVEFPFKGKGYNHQIAAVERAIACNALETPQMRHDDTLEIMQLMDDLRAQWGIRYPGE